MVWTIDLDDFTGTFCKQGKYPLISTLKSSLGLSGESLQGHRAGHRAGHRSSSSRELRWSWCLGAGKEGGREESSWQT